MVFMVCPKFPILLNVFDSEILEGNLAEKKLVVREMSSPKL